jgi:hypothetical protein
MWRTNIIVTGETTTSDMHRHAGDLCPCRGQVPWHDHRIPDASGQQESAHESR